MQGKDKKPSQNLFFIFGGGNGIVKSAFCSLFVAGNGDTCSGCLFPVYLCKTGRFPEPACPGCSIGAAGQRDHCRPERVCQPATVFRSEERRVGKECVRRVDLG